MRRRNDIVTMAFLTALSVGVVAQVNGCSLLLELGQLAPMEERDSGGGNGDAGGPSCVNDVQCNPDGGVTGHLLRCCTGECTDTTSDLNNCGQCGLVCTGATGTCCSSTCIDIETDPVNCGSCGHDCTVNGSNLSCVANACACPQDYTIVSGRCRQQFVISASQLSANSTDCGNGNIYWNGPYGFSWTDDAGSFGLTPTIVTYQFTVGYYCLSSSDDIAVSFNTTSLNGSLGFGTLSNENCSCSPADVQVVLPSGDPPLTLPLSAYNKNGQNTLTFTPTSTAGAGFGQASSLDGGYAMITVTY